MKCLDNIYTKQIKYNSPVLYQLESLKKEYEKLLKVSNEIIKTGSFIEECYFENQSAFLSDNEITFSGNLKFKTDAGNYFSNIPSSLKLNVQGTGEIVVDVGEDNKTLVFKLDEEFLSEISLMLENFETLKQKFESQIFDNFIGIRNTADSKIDQIKHINNNFQITSNDGKSLLNIDEQLEKISSFNKDLLTPDDIEMFEKVEYFYDKDDHNIDLSYPDGIFDGTTINVDTNKYKRVCGLYGIGNVPQGKIEFDLSATSDNKYSGASVSLVHISNALQIYWGRININIDKTTLTFDGGTIVGDSQDNYMYLWKLWGVLK